MRKSICVIVCLLICSSLLFFSSSAYAKVVTPSAVEAERETGETSVPESTEKTLTRTDIDTTIALLLCLNLILALGVGCLIGHFCIYRIR